MPNLPALRGLAWKTKDAGSPTVAAAIGMAAEAVRDVVAVKGKAVRPAGVVRRLGQ